jgi:hypothetical protein
MGTFEPLVIRPIVSLHCGLLGTCNTHVSGLFVSRLHSTMTLTESLGKTHALEGVSFICWFVSDEVSLPERMAVFLDTCFHLCIE